MDTKDHVWTVLRMRAKREHRVPLCVQALEVLNAARTLGDANGLVFPMRSGRSIATSTLPKMLQQHEVAAVPHGFRSSFRGLGRRGRGSSARSHRGRAHPRDPEQGRG